MPTKVLKITNEAQIDVEVKVPNNPKEGQDKSSSNQDDPPHPRVNKSNMGVVRRMKKKGNPLIMKEKKVLSYRKWNPGFVLE